MSILAETSPRAKNVLFPCGSRSNTGIFFIGSSFINSKKIYTYDYCLITCKYNNFKIIFTTCSLFSEVVVFQIFRVV